MQPLDDQMSSAPDQSSWWADDEGTTWPPCLANLIISKRHRARLRERASAIANPQLIAYALHCAHQIKPIESLDVLKLTLDQMEEGGYDFTAALDIQAATTSQERLPFSPADLPIVPSAPLAKVYQFPVRELGQSVSTPQPISVPNGNVRHSLARAEITLQKEIEQCGVPTDVEACRSIIRQTLGIRRRRTWDSDRKN